MHDYHFYKINESFPRLIVYKFLVEWLEVIVKLIVSLTPILTYHPSDPQIFPQVCYKGKVSAILWRIAPQIYQ